MIVDPPETVEVSNADLRTILTGIHHARRRGTTLRRGAMNALDTVVPADGETTVVNAERLWWLLDAAFQITEGTMEHPDLFDAANNAGGMLDMYAPRTSAAMQSVDHAEFITEHTPPETA